MKILITGGASGLGRAITQRFCGDGHAVSFTYSRSGAAAAEIVSQYPAAQAIACDFTDAEAVGRLVDRVPGMELDVLINNALVGMQTRHFHQGRPEAFLSSFEANVMPTLRITQQALKGFRKKKSGKVITVLSSYVVNRPPVGLSEYVANKAYLQSLSRSWATENARFGITANCVSPSMMLTPLTAAVDERQVEDAVAASPSGRLVAPEEVADTIMFLAQAGPHINGINMLMNGGSDLV